MINFELGSTYSGCYHSDFIENEQAVQLTVIARPKKNIITVKGLFEEETTIKVAENNFLNCESALLNKLTLFAKNKIAL